MLQICYSNGDSPYLTGLAPVIPPPELRGEDRTKIIAVIPPLHNPKQDQASPNSPASAEYIKHAHPRGGLQSPSHKANGPAGITHWAARTARCTPSSSAPRFNRANSEFHHRKLRLAYIAQRAAPVVRNRGEARARGDTFFGKAFFFVVDPAANQADPALIFSHFNYFAHDVLFFGSVH